MLRLSYFFPHHQSLCFLGIFTVMALMSDFKSLVYILFIFLFPMHFTLLSTGSSQTTTDQTCAEIPPDLQRLSDDFYRLLDKEIMADATLTCHGQTWRVHKSILTARSEVFAAKIHSGMSDKETDVIHVEDLEPTVLDSLLKYVYGGKAPGVSDQNVSDLYKAADRYALLGLREALSNWMVNHLTYDNCLFFLVEAEQLGDAELKEAALSFIIEHFSFISYSVWTTVCQEHSLLAIEVLQHFAPVMKK